MYRCSHADLRTNGHNSCLFVISLKFGFDVGLFSIAHYNDRSLEIAGIYEQISIHIGAAWCSG